MKLLERIKLLFEESAGIHTSQNPLVPLLSRYSRHPDLELTAARLGFALKVIHADSQVTTEEVSMLKELLRRYLGEPEEKINLMAAEMLKIDNVDLEMTYFARTMNEKMSEQDRQDFLLDLFHVAHADSEYAMFEESDLRVISKYLLLSHSLFVQTRNRAQRKSSAP